MLGHFDIDEDIVYSDNDDAIFNNEIKSMNTEEFTEFEPPMTPSRKSEESEENSLKFET